MSNQSKSGLNLSARGIGAPFGVLVGIAGAYHGIGEILQGNVPAESMYIESWKVGPIAAYMGGEPALTLIPNLLITGILAVLFGLAVIVWSGFRMRRSRDGWILMLLCLGLLLVGGGIAPPLLGIIAGSAATGTTASYQGWAKRIRGGLRNFLAALWPFIYTLYLLNAVFLVLGSLVLVFAFSYNNPDLFVYCFFGAVLSFPLLILSGIARDLKTAQL